MCKGTSKQSQNLKNYTTPGPRPPVLKFLDPPLRLTIVQWFARPTLVRRPNIRYIRSHYNSLLWILLHGISMSLKWRGILRKTYISLLVLLIVVSETNNANFKPEFNGWKGFVPSWFQDLEILIKSFFSIKWLNKMINIHVGFLSVIITCTII